MTAWKSSDAFKFYRCVRSMSCKARNKDKRIKMYIYTVFSLQKETRAAAAIFALSFGPARLFKKDKM